MAGNKKNVHENHRARLRDRFIREGALSFEAHELLELFLFGVIPRRNTNPTAHLLLDRFGSLEGVFTAPYEELIKTDGVGERAARYIIDSYREFVTDIEEKFGKNPMTTFECAANYLIWHRNIAAGAADADEYITVLLLNGSFELLETYDTASRDSADIISRMTDTGAEKVLLGVYPSFDISLSTALTEAGIEVVDVIEVSSFDAKSII